MVHIKLCIMRQFVIFIENINDVKISDIQELNNRMYATQLSKTTIKPLVDDKLYYIKQYVKIIELNYFDMYIKVINDQGSTFIGQIIDGIDIEVDLPADIYIESFKKDNENYYLYVKY